MNIEIASFGKMSQTGSALLRSIQNHNLPTLDLFVREAVQNSLDAALPSADYLDSVVVDIGTKEIDVPKLVRHFEGISDILLQRFGQQSQKSIYIVDKHTVGLTGHLNYMEVPSNEAGNIFKLIYGISMPQTKEGAGGSWGLGKTIYFRLGIGLVIYYSRIQQEDGSYEERLAAALVEDEESPSSIIPAKDKNWHRGIAWWGNEIEKDSTIPITDSETITDILVALNMERFIGEETGTQVIIPFINEEKLIVRDEEQLHISWENSVQEYLNMALQRWYAPRLDNQFYPHGKWLDGRVNGERVKRENMIKTFQEIQVLYNLATSGDIPEILKDKEYYLYDANLQRTFKSGAGQKAGTIAFKKYKEDELYLIPPNNLPSPFTCVNKENIGEKSNSPIVTYVRKPGMLINYELSGEWCNGIEISDKEYLLAIFVPNSDIYLVPNEDNVVTLEAYLRKSEEADHASWCNIILDGKKSTIVSRIQSRMRSKILETYSNKEERIKGDTTTMMAKKFGKILLPPSGFGQRAGVNKKKLTPGGQRSSSKSNFQITSQSFTSNGSVQIYFKLKLSKKVATAQLSLIVLSESGNITATDWGEAENGIGTAFPAKINKVVVNEYNSKVYGEMITSDVWTKEGVQMVMDSSPVFKKPYALKIIKDKDTLQFEGTIEFESNDPFLKVSLSLKAEEN